MPIKGDRTINKSVLVQPDRTMACQPAFAKAAPAYPPISACDELTGIPKYQVNRFQKMAPNNPARMTVRFTISSRIMPPPMVFATAVPNTKAATKLKKAAQSTAWRGESTRVETTVAMELAAS